MPLPLSGYKLPSEYRTNEKAWFVYGFVVKNIVAKYCSDFMQNAQYKIRK